MLTRKQYNHALTKAARTKGTYAELLAVWDAEKIAALRTEGVTPAKALPVLLGKSVAKTVVAAAPKKAPARKAPAKALTAGPIALTGRAVTRIVAMADKVEPKTTANFPCGGAYVVIFVDGRNPVVKHLKDNGFTRTGTGEYRRYFTSGTSADAALEKADFAAARLSALLTNNGVESATYAATWID